MNDDGEFVVFISHGKSHLWKDVARYIENELEFRTVILAEAINRGKTVIEKLDEETEDCDFAVILMTADDETKARQNVIHEIGFCQGKLGRENVLVLLQTGVEKFSNISGIVYEEFIGDNIKSTFLRIEKELEDAFEDLEE
ncbi:TIR domain-containing protein [Leptospira sp. SA-E8]|uniref:TIR domain-containing protein n=1 Tax=Leptospira sp. SA-E8 TaxID=3422259 RepID=UPI003EBDCA91